MDVASLHGSFGRIVQTVCLCALPVALWAFGAIWLHERGICPFRRFRGMLKSLHGVLVAVATAALVAWAGTKPSLTPPQGLNAGMRQLQPPGDGVSSAEPDPEDGGGVTTDGTPVAVGEFAVASVTTNAVCDFSPPANAAVYWKWLRRGAARDWFTITNGLTWAFPFGTSAVRRITVSSTGAAILHPDFTAATNADERLLRDVFDPGRAVPADAALLAPLRACLGIVPLLNWSRTDVAESRFWSASMPSNTLLLTWQNVLLDRSPERPVSFQVELTPGGRFRFAYDLRSVAAGELATNVLAGAFCGGCRVTVAPPPGAVSVFDFRVENPVDTDGEGLNDAEEMLYGTDPELADTDDDGLNDHDEVVRGTNPIDPDSDADGLSDGEEVSLGSNPLVADTDGDGLGDGLEVEVYGSSPLVTDTDGDGVGDAAEVQAGTSPVLADTDGDGLSDPAEVTAGTNPLLKDTDGDGATDGEEVAAGSDPLVRDTDGDGVADRDEIENGSDPTDPKDGGISASRVPVNFTFGDPSSRRSEKYRLVLEPVPESGPGETPPTKSWLNENYGECETKTAMLTKGWTYEVSLHHSGTNIEDGSPDYDYMLSWSVSPCCGCVTNDPDGLIGADSVGSSFTGEGKVAKILVLDGGIWADYDRVDGIDGSDKLKAYRGRSLRHWYNDDDDEGPTNETPIGDVPAASSTPDCANGHVDGRCDVLDFTPVWIDMGAALNQMSEQLGKNCTLTLAQEDGAVNLVWTSLTGESVAGFLKTDVTGCGESFGSNLAAAETVRLTEEELELPESFVNMMKGDRNKGVILIEGRSPDGDSSAMSVSPLVLRVYEKPRSSDATPLCELRLPLNLSSVEEMYDVSSIRSVCDDSTPISGTFGGNLPESNGTTVFFLHGFNVSAEGSRAWFAEMFKRLWQSGSNARFRGVGWHGDYNLVSGRFNAMHYHRDVYNALQSAPAFAGLVGGTSGNKVVIAHSLGNMVAAKAISDGLAVGKYFMLDAAVPSEAFDATLQDETTAVRRKYVPSSWLGYDPLSWAANWHRWFPDDDRGRLKWRGLFAEVPDLTDIYNYYSDGDEVFEEEDKVPSKYSRIFHWPTVKSSWPFVETGGMLTPARCAWQKQEVLKGIDLLFGTLDGGWGFHCWQTVVSASPPTFQTKRYTAEEANAMVRDGSVKMHPVFNRSESAMFDETIAESNVNHVLAYNIPAISSATGKMSTIKGKSETFNLNLNSSQFKSNDWGRDHRWYQKRWLHSDMKDMAYFHVYKLFDDLCTKGNIR